MLVAKPSIEGASSPFVSRKTPSYQMVHGDNKYKGRVVFDDRGHQVRDQNWDIAMFQELSSAPATMEATKTCDLYGALPGHHVEQSDATQAYTQAVLTGTKTWVSLPP